MIYCEKIKLRPNNVLLARLEQLAMIARFNYNFMLAELIRAGYSKAKKPTLGAIFAVQKHYHQCVKTRMVYNKDGELYDENFQENLASAPSQICDNICKDLHRAFSTLKKHNTPSFKKKSAAKISFTLQKKVDSTFKLETSILTVSKLSFNVNKARFLKDANQIKLVTISKSNYGWYLSITEEIPDDTFLGKLPLTGRTVGIDWGIKNFASDSEGHFVSFKNESNYKSYVASQHRLKLLQRRLSKKRLASSNWKSSKRYLKLKNKIAYLYEKLVNIRKNFIHAVTKVYLSEFDLIAIENLKPSNMLKNHKLARSIAEAMFYTWKVILQYKAPWYGKEVRLVSPRNTSQTCSECGHVLETKLKLSEREFHCPVCGYHEDRDTNAAKNILALA